MMVHVELSEKAHKKLKISTEINSFEDYSETILKQIRLPKELEKELEK